MRFYEWERRQEEYVSDVESEEWTTTGCTFDFRMLIIVTQNGRFFS